MKKSIYLVAFNNLVTFPLALSLSLYLKNWEVDMSFEVEKLPDSITLMATIVFMMLCEDLAFHFSHRILHWKRIYPYIHKIHH